MARKKADERRELHREQLWPESADRIWNGADEKGWWAAPRVLPLVLHLTSDKKLVGQRDCSAVYLEILSRDFGQGIVEIRDQDEHAYCAGYTSRRARRSWQERMRDLERIGFLEIKPKGNNPFGYVLVVHPVRAATAMREQGQVTEEWWNLFRQQLLESTGQVLEDPLMSGKPGMSSRSAPHATQARSAGREP